MAEVIGESPGGAAPPEPLDFQKAREAVKRIMWGQPTEPTLSDEDFIFATLDQAESEIARLREENAAARCEALALFNAMDHGPAEPLDTVAGIISQISNMVAGLRPPGETAEHVMVSVEAACAAVCVYCRESRALTPNGMWHILGTVPGDSKPTESWCYGEVIRRLVPSVSPSVPKEDK